MLEKWTGLAGRLFHDRDRSFPDSGGKATSSLLKNSKTFKRPIWTQHFTGFSHRQQDVQKGPSSKAAGALAGGAYEGVREHDKGPRTQLADFFNTLLGNTRLMGRQHRTNLFGHQVSRKPVTVGIPVPLAHFRVRKSM